MPATPATPPRRVGCSACPDGENTAPGSNKSMPNYTHGSVGRTLGRRSLDAVRSVRGSIRGRRVLHATTNHKPASQATSVSAGSSPVAAKQRWYDSLRSRATQIPMPSSPISMSSTLKRSRFFRSSPIQPPSPGLSPSSNHHASRVPLPRLELPSFESELRQLAIFDQVHASASHGTNLWLTYLELRPARFTD